MREIIVKLADDLKEELVSIRRELHKNPELSLKEYETSKFITKKLKQYGIEEVYDDIYETTVMAVIRGGKSGKTVLIRADIDALPINEMNDSDYKSCNDGVMHGCGHDSHVTWILGATIILNKYKDNLCGNVKVLFQPAEEGEGGADTLLSKRDILIEDPKVDCAIAGHVWPSVKSGEIGIVNGCAMAAANKFTLEIIGKGGHGAEPHNTIDPIALANQVYMSLQQIVSRKVNPYESSVLTVGLFKAEGAYNVIPDKVYMEGTVRGESYDRVIDVMDTMDAIVKGIVEPQGGKYNLTSSKEIHAVINDKQLVEFSNHILSELIGNEKVHILPYGSMTGEDFCYFSERVPSLFMYVGTRNEEKGIVQPLHNPKFDIDEDILNKAAASVAYLTFRYLESNR